MDYTTRVFTHPDRKADDPIFVNADSPDQRVTWETYSSHVKRAAVSLRKLDIVKPGDCVGLLSDSDIYYWVLADAIIAAGGIFSPLPVLEREDQLATYLAAANIQCLFVSPEHENLASQVKDRAPKVLIFDSPARKEAPQIKGISFTFLLSGEESEWKLESFGSPEERIALRTFTSGTTGGVKAVEISHAALVARIDAKDFVPDPTDSSHLQFIHLASGSSQIICQRAAAGYLPIYVTSFDDELSIIDRIESCKISLIQLPPRTMELIADAIESGKRHAKSLESLNHILVGGSPSHKDQVKRFASLIPQHIFLRTGYGSTEGGLIAMTPPSHSWFEQGTVGLVIEGVELQIVDHETLEPCEEGEVCIRSTSVYTRYYENFEATEKTFLPSKDGRPWFRTGDRGYFDKDSGQLALVGRFNEMITLGTVRIIPSEIEAELLNHPSIADAAITTTELQGFEGPEQCLAYIVKSDESLTAQEVHDFIAKRVSSKKAPKSVVFCKKIPRNSAVKIMRKSLRELENLPGSMLTGLA